MLSQHPHRVDTPLNPHFQLPTDLFPPTGLLGLQYGHHQGTLGELALTSLANPDSSYNVLFINPYQEACHHGLICCPGRMGIIRPLCD